MFGRGARYVLLARAFGRVEVEEARFGKSRSERCDDKIRGERHMSVDVGSPAKALVGDAADRGVTEKGSGAPGRGVLALLCLISVAWIGALIYGAVQAVDFVRGVI